MTHPHVSVIMPCYNQAHFLPEAVASVVAQTYRDWEIIIIDDESPDATAQVAQQLIDRYAGYSIRLLRQANTGLPGARNAGIREARGSIIMPLDADDTIHPQMLEHAVPIFAEHPEVGFVYSDTRLFGDEHGILQNMEFDRRRLRVICLLHALSPFRRVAWEQVGGYRHELRRGYEDWDFWMNLSEAGWMGYHIPKPLLNYRRTAASKLSRDQKYDLELRAQLIKYHPQSYEPGFRAWARRVTAPGWMQGEQFRPQRWLLAYLLYNLQIARYQWGELPRTLLHPIYWRTSPRLRSRLRLISRAILR